MSRKPQTAAPEATASRGRKNTATYHAERFEMQLTDAVTGEVIGLGGGDTPEEAAQRAIEDARAAGQIEK